MCVMAWINMGYLIVPDCKALCHIPRISMIRLTVSHSFHRQPTVHSIRISFMSDYLPHNVLYCMWTQNIVLVIPLMYMVYLFSCFLACKMNYYIGEPQNCIQYISQSLVIPVTKVTVQKLMLPGQKVPDWPKGSDNDVCFTRGAVQSQGKKVTTHSACS